MSGDLSPAEESAVERVARAMRLTRECQAGMAFGVPPDARDLFINALATAALTAMRPAPDTAKADEGAITAIDAGFDPDEEHSPRFAGSYTCTLCGRYASDRLHGAS